MTSVFSVTISVTISVTMGVDFRGFCPFEWPVTKGYNVDIHGS